MSLFTRIGARSSRLDLHVLNPSDVVSLNDIESDAYDHWIFDKGNSDGLVGRVAGRVLTAQSDAPTYSSNYLTMSSAVGKSLKSDFGDAANLVVTVFAVAKVASSGNAPVPLFGTYISSTGFMHCVANGGASAVYFRGVSNAVPLSIEASSSFGLWKFYAISCDLASASKFVRGVTGSAYAAAAPATGAYAPTANGIALGNPDYALSPVQSTSFAEFGILYGTRTQAELLALYNRSKNRMASRGILLT